MALQCRKECSGLLTTPPFPVKREASPEKSLRKTGTTDGTPKLNNDLSEASVMMIHSTAGYHKTWGPGVHWSDH